MDASLQSRAEQLASEMASQATTVEDLNGLLRVMMKSGLERMLNTEMDVHLGHRSAPTLEALDPDRDASEAALPKKKPNRRNGRSRRGKHTEECYFNLLLA